MLLTLAGLEVGAFAETVYVRPEDKVTKEFSENQLSEAQIASDIESAAGRRIGMPRGGGDDATVVSGETILRGARHRHSDRESLYGPQPELLTQVIGRHECKTARQV